MRSAINQSLYTIMHVLFSSRREKFAELKRDTAQRCVKSVRSTMSELYNAVDSSKKLPESEVGAGCRVFVLVGPSQNPCACVYIV